MLKNGDKLMLSTFTNVSESLRVGRIVSCRSRRQPVCQHIARNIARHGRPLNAAIRAAHHAGDHAAGNAVGRNDAAREHARDHPDHHAGRPDHALVLLAQAILFRGAGFAVVWPQFLALAGIGAALFCFALVRIRKTIRDGG